ncbi:aldose 1-epimerase [Roseivivax lentus]|uniref:Aldose 1-epimerase n=1 Tax=Roseivivax lentus TaxID=633194 RepID=A0A1N7NK23_9RHOB|nr:aldose epimerase family protein [Roseivivax lentus]SIS98529.1 aldose 1-epimerase [Roseivivax lentus]
MSADIRPLRDTDAGPFVEVALGSGPVRARVTNAGAALIDLRHAAVGRPLILGFDDPQRYLDNTQFMGPLVGRVANRIAGARAVIAGMPCRFPVNEGDLILHGGPDGAWRKLWTLQDASAAHARFALTLPDWHMGFPGTLEVVAEYRVAGAALHLNIEAVSDRETLCNFASHVYYARGPETRLRIAADHYQPVDARNVPEGDPAPVAGTRFDYRAGQPVTEPIDHNLCLSRHREARRPVAALIHPDCTLHLETTEPGLQVYDGRHLDLAGGLDGAHYGPGSGVALEPQAWVDAPNRSFADQVVLRPGNRYRQETAIRLEPA